MKLAIYGTKWIGDAVMTVPAIRRLRDLYPEAELTLYSSQWSKGLFEDCDFIDRTLHPEADPGRQGLISECGIWREEKFDLAVIFPNSFRSALISRLGGAKSRFGYAGEGRGIFLTRAFRKPKWKNERHEVYYYLHLVAEIERFESGTKIPDSAEPDTQLTVSEVRRADARKTLISVGVDLSKPLIGLGVGSQNSDAKRWPAKSYAALNDRLQQDLNATVLLMGSEAESEVCERVLRESVIPPISLAGKTSLSEAVALLSEMDVFVSNDMGLAHVSSALGTDTITIFGPTNPATTRPFTASVLRREDVDCSPCMLRSCPIDHRCMTRISTDDVIQKISETIAHKK